MIHKILESFYQGHCLNAYDVFGAHISEKNGVQGVTFCVYAPHAQGIQVIGSFNHWIGEAHEMERIDDKGTWQLFIPHIKEGDMYKYRITQCNGNVVDKMDPYAFSSELRPHTASIITKWDESLWSDTTWMSTRSKHIQEPLNIYEMHIGSWKKEGYENGVTYEQLVEDLIPYLKQNHFTHVEFLPLHEYPYDGSWGYQCSGYYSATSRYGTCEQLIYLINALHREHIGVILDFVPIHFVKDMFSLASFDGTRLYEYDYDHDAQSQWGTLNFHLWKEEVRSFLMSAAAFWLDKYHVDGLRMDAVSHLIYWQGNKHRGINEGALAFIKRFNYHLSQQFPHVMFIAEDSSDFPKVTHPVWEGGLGFDYKWDLGWMHDTLQYLSMDPIYRKWHHHKLTFSMLYFYSEKFLLPFSHDEVVHGKKTIIDKIWGTYEQKFSQLKTLYMYMFTHPGKKLNFMGNEIAHFREWDEQKENDWFLLRYPIHDAFHRYFRTLCAVYKEKEALYMYDYEEQGFLWLDADNVDENVYSYIRRSENRDIVVILNFCANAYHRHVCGVPTKGLYKEILNSEQDCWGGHYSTRQKIRSKRVRKRKFPYQITVNIPAFGGVMLEVKKSKIENRKKGV